MIAKVKGVQSAPKIPTPTPFLGNVLPLSKKLSDQLEIPFAVKGNEVAYKYM